MKTDSINFTDDLVEGFCAESGTNLAMMKKMYEHYSLELTNRIRTNEYAIEAPIKHLGTFFLPLHGACIYLNKKKWQDEFFNTENTKEKVKFFEARKQHVIERIKKCKDCGIKRVKYLYTLISRIYVKNG